MVTTTVVSVVAGTTSTLTISGTYWILRMYGFGARYWRIKSRDARRAHRDAAYMRRTWKPIAALIGLYLKDKRLGKRAAAKGGAALNPKIRYPKLKSITSDEFGVTADFRLVPSVKLKDFQNAAEDLANYWEMVRVTAEQPEPNHVTVRAVRRDPLITKTVAVFPEQPSTLRYYPAGLDDFGRPADIRLHHSSGMGVYGLPTYGKTSFLLGLITYFAPSDSVAFLIADGKTATGYEGDYMDVAPRALSIIGDDMRTFNQWIKQINLLRRMRSSTIRQALGVRNFWDVGPTPEWPLVFAIMDEAHSFFEQTPAGGSGELRDHNAVAADNAYQTSDLVRKCQSVGIIPVLATQKGTSDAIPSMITANMSSAVCFAVRTSEAAQAALGKAISAQPDANPINYQSEDYIGVATMMAANRPGYVRFRSPYCREIVAAAACERTAHLVRPEACPGIEVGQAHRALLAADDADDLLDIWQANGKFDKEG